MKNREFVHSGKRDRKVIIQQQSITQNAYGENVISWSTIHTLFAVKNPRTGREGFEANQLTAVDQDTFGILYRSGIKPTMRLLEGDLVYNILAVKEIGRKEGMELICERKDNDRADGR